MVDFLCREKDEEEVYRQYFSHRSTIHAAAPEQGAPGVDRGLFKKIHCSIPRRGHDMAVIRYKFDFHGSVAN
jgi:hypothetical protein